jgi:site-specific DNA-adenine methylase
MTKATREVLRSPYPFFGGKSKVAGLVWERFGDVRNYVECFFGSGAMLLGRPHWPFSETRIETVNDLDGMISNFWRAIAADPDAVASMVAETVAAFGGLDVLHNNAAALDQNQRAKVLLPLNWL